MPRLGYNERSWAIDIISEINMYCSSINRTINRAGGENSLSFGTKTLFPDILLYSNQASASVLQGWELKFPDTSIIDNDLIENGIKKAKRLSLNSFLVWNVTSAVLYVEENGEFEVFHNWSDLHDIKRRNDVEENKSRWIDQLRIIIDDLNNFFDDGSLFSKPILKALDNDLIIEFISKSSSQLEAELNNIASRNAEFEAYSNIWWKNTKLEYPKRRKWNVLGSTIIIEWYNRIIFAHIVKRSFSPANAVEQIKENTTVDDAILIFDEITNACDFYQIFNVELFGEVRTILTNEIWINFIELNVLLSDFNLEELNQNLLQDMLESLVSLNKRKIAGQFSTPTNLADFLAGLTILDRTESVFDPCCGTGTIPKSVYKYKISHNISAQEVLDKLFISDKFTFPLQLASLSIANPDNIGIPIKIFRKDITELTIDENLEIRDPSNGEIISFNFPKVKYIISNLPFVQQEDLSLLNPDISRINEEIQRLTNSDFTLDGRSDLYIYIPFYLYNLLETNGTISIILSNSWLATSMGKKFRDILRYFYSIKYIIVSGNSRWFSNADVVTSVMVLDKKNEIAPPSDESIKFISLNIALNSDDTNVQEIVDHIITGNESDSYKMTTYTTDEINGYEILGLQWSSLFTDLEWLTEIGDRLIPVNQIFKVGRGERRGWNQLFYPQGDHGIEEIYLRPVLKSPTEIDSLITDPQSVAFCCSRSLSELEELGHTGAIAWIRRFENEVNTTGIPLPEALRRSNIHWYEMNDSTTADFAPLLNPDRRLFIAKMRTRSFVDQRLTRFTIIDRNQNMDIIFALLNSITSVFYMEALGFGRGLGVLDLNTTRLKDSMKMLNPDLLSEDNRNRIIEAFKPIISREIYNIEDELNRVDRLNFENIVLESFNIEEYYESIFQAFKTLYKIRKSVND